MKATLNLQECIQAVAEYAERKLGKGVSHVQFTMPKRLYGENIPFSATVDLVEPKPQVLHPYRTTTCPKCGSSDILNASQSRDCNACGHFW